MQFVTLQEGHGFEGWIGQLVDSGALDGWDPEALNDTSVLLNHYVTSESVLYEAVEQLLLLLGVIPAPLKKMESLPWVSQWLQPNSATSEEDSDGGVDMPISQVPPLRIRKHLKSISFLQSLKLILKENHVVADYVIISVGKSLRKPEGCIILDAKALFGTDSLLEIFSSLSSLDTSHLHRIASTDSVRLLIATIGAPEFKFGPRPAVEAGSEFVSSEGDEVEILPLEDVLYPLPIRCEPPSFEVDEGQSTLDGNDLSWFDADPWGEEVTSNSTTTTKERVSRRKGPRDSRSLLLRRQRARPCLLVGQSHLVALFKEWCDGGCKGKLLELFRSGNQQEEDSELSSPERPEEIIRDTEDPPTCSWFEIRPPLKPIPSSLLFEPRTKPERRSGRRHSMEAKDLSVA